VPVEVAIAPEAAFVHADPTLLEQAIVNLLDNAARYAPPGTPVDVTAEMRAGRLAISVSDAGPGVPPHLREHVFDLFWRASTGDRQGAGTGLGLSIVRGFVEAMDGRVTVGERPGGGARFTVELPQQARPALPAEDADG
jgi:two-component system sensor histidine kinase KdpD